ISGALTIKYNNLIDGTSKGAFINSNKINNSNITFLISVKVINQIVIDHKLTKFILIENLNSSSINKRTRANPSSAAIALTTPLFRSKKTKVGKIETLLAIPTKKKKKELGDNDNKGNRKKEEGKKEEEQKEEGKIKAEKKEANSASRISLRRIRPPFLLASLENITNLRVAALRFLTLVAKTPTYTYTVLIKYTALKSFYSKGKMDILLYKNISVDLDTSKTKFKKSEFSDPNYLKTAKKPYITTKLFMETLARFKSAKIYI
ncbi:uncharacterized protein N7484_005304, partial [Penicillium longicatenatum]|uniref:uncharacterized protein n=1 Tax=Penicillium longicatenatum TaxID=1561947 RepID=UPI002547D039